MQRANNAAPPDAPVPRTVVGSRIDFSAKLTISRPLDLLLYLLKEN